MPSCCQVGKGGGLRRGGSGGHITDGMCLIRRVKGGAIYIAAIQLLNRRGRVRVAWQASGVMLVL